MKNKSKAIINTLNKIEFLCLEQSGSKNEFFHNETKYFYELNEDKSSGNVFQTWIAMEGINKGKECCGLIGDFSISSNGKVSGNKAFVSLSQKTPKFILDFINLAQEFFVDFSPKNKILHGDVFLNDKKCKIASTLIKNGDKISIKTDKKIVFEQLVEFKHKGV